MQRRKRGNGMRQFIHTEDSVCDPILNGNTIQDIIEMSTSGSGSGEIHIQFTLYIYILLIFQLKF